MIDHKHRLHRDLISIVEAAYARINLEQAWLQGIADAALPCVDQGMGVSVYTYDATDPTQFRVPACAAAGNTEVNAQAIEVIVRGGPPEFVAHTHLPMPPMYFSKIARELARRHIPGAAQAMQSMARYGVTEVLAIRGCDTSLRGCQISAVRRTPGRLTPLQARVFACLGAHLASGWRLRQARAEVQDADAVLDVRGRFLHLENGTVLSGRRHLSQAFEARRHAREQVRNHDELTALGLWRAMVQGEWTLVDHIDTDGRRFVLARRNRPHVAEIAALDKRERQVATYVAYGFSLKHIGYELGLAPATISEHLKSSLRKLRLRNRAELVALLGHHVSSARDDPNRPAQ